MARRSTLVDDLTDIAILAGLAFAGWYAWTYYIDPDLIASKQAENPDSGGTDFGINDGGLLGSN